MDLDMHKIAFLYLNLWDIGIHYYHFDIKNINVYTKYQVMQAVIIISYCGYLTNILQYKKCLGVFR